MKDSCQRATAKVNALLAHRLPVGASALVLGALLGAAIPVAAMPQQDTEVGRLHSNLEEIAKLASREVKPPLVRLARKLPPTADRIERLREPASTAQAQIGIALNELQQMKALVVDPHYLPAVVAAGRAYIAVSGKDPATGTTINPDYGGLEPELAANEAGLDALAIVAGKASSRVRLLTRLLIRAKRRAHRLERLSERR